jgi:hypothetical protein
MRVDQRTGSIANWTAAGLAEWKLRIRRRE